MILAYVPHPDGLAALVGVGLIVWGILWGIGYVIGQFLLWIGVITTGEREREKEEQREAKRRKKVIACETTIITIEWIARARHWVVVQTYEGKEDVLDAGTFRKWADAKNYAYKREVFWRNKVSEERQALAAEREHNKTSAERQAEQDQQDWERQKTGYKERQLRKQQQPWKYRRRRRQR